MTAPRFIATELPVNQVIWLGNDRIFTLQKPEPTRGVTTTAVSVIYDVKTGEKLAERAWNNMAGYSEVSPDGRFWLATETNDGYSAANCILRDLRDFSTITTMPAGNEYFRWLDSRRFLRTRYNRKSSSDPLSHQSIWQLDEKTNRVSQTRAMKDDLEIGTLSPNGKWAIQRTGSDRISREMKSVVGNLTNLSFTSSNSYVVALPAWETVSKLSVANLSNEQWSAMRWSSDSNALYGVVHLGGILGRTDILRYNLQKRSVTSVKLKNTMDALVPYNLNVMESRFSPDCRLWCASSFDGSRWAFWNTETGELVKTIGSIPKKPENYVPALAPGFSSDSRYFLRPTKNGVEIYDISRFSS